MPKRKAFSQFVADLGCPLKNVLWSWASISPEKNRAIFTVWADLLKQGRYVFLPNKSAPWKDTNGGRELRTILRSVMDNRMESLGVLQYVVDPKATPRKRKGYDPDTLLLLQFAEEDDGLVAYVTGEVSTEEALRGRVTHRVKPVAYALDDIGEPPEGMEQPDRALQVTSGYRRDSKVRAFAVRRAKGCCELCGEAGFITANGRPYLEAHHIISLANAGPDTVMNVIALCPKHHRQAHFGEDAEMLEVQMLKKLQP